MLPGFALGRQRTPQEEELWRVQGGQPARLGLRASTKIPMPPEGVGGAENCRLSENCWGLGQWGVGETITDLTAKVPRFSGHHKTLCESGVVPGRRIESNNDKNKMHCGLRVAIKEI